MIEEPQSAAVPSLRWPTEPYRGYSQYGQDDVALFAGREHEIVEFAQMIADRETRLVLLQGATGCGKSSFLRAGVIPFLETAGRGFYFRKGTEGQERGKAIFLRSTAAPLERLAEEVFNFAVGGYRFTSPVGVEEIDLRSVLAERTRLEDFVGFVRERPEGLVDVLRDLSAALPVSLILIIDQGEEALYKATGRKSRAAVEPYFQFLKAFTAADFPLKLIVSLRTDWFGLFISKIPTGSMKEGAAKQYLLDDIEQKGLIEAITRPTGNLPFKDVSLPPYDFRFEAGLPERIVMEILERSEEKGLAGGELPALQVVCEALYWRVRARPKPWVIGTADYEALGGLDGQLADHLDRILVAYCRRQRIGALAQTVCEWKDALALLVRVQPNNAVGSTALTEQQLGAPGTAGPAFSRLLKHLSQDDIGVLREETSPKHRAATAATSFVLRHDAIGLVLQNWMKAREANFATTSAMYPVSVAFFLFYFLFGSLCCIGGLWSLAHEYSFEAVAVIIAGVFLLILGTLLLVAGRMDKTSFAAQVFAFDVFLMVARRPYLGRVLRASDEGKALETLEQNPVFRLLLNCDDAAKARFLQLKDRAKSELGTVDVRTKAAA